MYNHVLYFYYWVANSLVLLLLHWFFPQDIVLGNWRFVPAEAAIYAGFWLTFWVWLFWDFALGRKFPLRAPVFHLIYFWLVNSFSIWLVGRLANYSGLGLSSFVWALAVGLVAHYLQQWVRRWVVSGSTG
jgi:hypothetical protein